MPADQWPSPAHTRSRCAPSGAVARCTVPLNTYKRPSGWYYIRGVHMGARIDQSARTRNGREAAALARELERRISDAALRGPARCYAEAALGYMDSGGDTLGQTALIEAFGEMDLAAISQTDLDALSTRVFPNAAPSTRLRRVYTPFIAVWNWAAYEGWVSPRKWRKPRPGAPRLDWRRPDEIERLIAACEPHLARLVCAYIASGARAAELYTLRPHDVSPGADRITLWETKGGYSRHVDLCPRGRDAVAAGLDTGGAWVFAHGRGERWKDHTSINRALVRAATVAGTPPLSCHVLRHTWASWAYCLTGDLAWLMQQGGWRSPQLAMRYIHAATDGLAADVLAHGWEIGGRRIIRRA